MAVSLLLQALRHEMKKQILNKDYVHMIDVRKGALFPGQCL